MKKTLLILTPILFLTALVGCQNADRKKDVADSSGMEQDTMSEEELYRPNFHFTPKKGWMNDPNGMFFYNEYYHLYYQHYPDGNTWGPMHWGHAISTDMVTWKEQPIALYPDELGYIFSGSAVVDHDNTSGFGVNGITPVIAMYTSHDSKKEESDPINVETQSIAYSLDEGISWTKYEGNPVIKNPGIKDFRDPKITWDTAGLQWVMVLAAGQVTHFYGSENLKDWKLLSTFGEGIGNHGGVWECPDLFPLPVEGTEDVKWVHLVSINPGGLNGGSATQYFVGDFDGKTFTVDENFAKEMQTAHTFWVDFGKDNYAGVTWSDIPETDGRRLFIGWMSNWQYANEVPTENWRSAMTLPRELKLISSEESYRLSSTPVKELEEYRGTKFKKDRVTIKNEEKIIDSKMVDLRRAEINFQFSDLEATVYTFELSNSRGDILSFGYNHRDQYFFIDRSAAGITNFSGDFGDKISKATKGYISDKLEGTILLDKTSIELFFDNGKTAMTEIFFPKAPFETLTLKTENQKVILDYIEIHELKFN